MFLVDTHCHLYDEAFDADRDEAIQRAVQAGVGMMLLPDIDRSTTDRLDTLWNKHPDLFRTMTGLHPTSVKDDFEAELEHVRKRLFGLSAKPPFVAVGEIGMDLYWDKTYEAQQREALKCQMRWAEQADLPVCLHIRKAMNEVMGLLRDMGRHRYRGVMHCFGGSVQEAMRAVEMGFYIGVGGVVTFKNATLADVVRAVPLQRIVLETDAPYLSPMPYRGRRNESAHVAIVAERVAALRGISPEEVAVQTSDNARRLFAL